MDIAQKEMSANSLLATLINNYLGDYYQNHDQNFFYNRWRAFLIKDDEFINEENELLEKSKCKICEYSIQPFDYHFCRNCKKFFHKRCVNDLPIDYKDYSCIDENSNSWCCYDCRECKFCLSFKDRQELLACSDCNLLFHSYCTFIDSNNSTNTSVQQTLNIESIMQQQTENLESRLPKNPNDRNTLEPSSIKCDECSRCFNCYSLLSSNPELIRMFSDKQVCNNCWPKYEMGEFCPICLTVISENIKLFKNKRCFKNLVRCECRFWVHRCCDALLFDETNWKAVCNSKAKDVSYFCPHCRDTMKDKQVSILIDILIK